jgi:predicted enzyme related to lactoylglutathione lyase
MSIQLENITLAVDDVEAMVRFYDAVFGCDLQPYQPFGDVRGYRGTLAGIELVMVPNSIAQVDARQNRQQLQFAVDDVEATVDRAVGSGGTPLDEAEIRRGRMSGAVYDPDGNSIVFVEAETL